jgi:hypothetical protein
MNQPVYVLALATFNKHASSSICGDQLRVLEDACCLTTAPASNGLANLLSAASASVAVDLDGVLGGQE